MGHSTQLFVSNYIYTVYKNLRIVSLICFFALTSNLVGNFVWTYLENKQSISLSSEEDESDENKGNSKRAVNLLEEELHLAEQPVLSSPYACIGLNKKATFSTSHRKTIASDQAPLDNPPEWKNEFS